MKKSKLITLIDIAAFISFIFVVSTGVLMRYVLPPRSGQSIEILGMSRHEWGDIHFYITFIFLAILSIHLVLHWKFIRNMFHARIKEASNFRLMLGLVGLIAVLALALAPFVAPKEYSETSEGYQFGKYRN
ncbi:MAG: DUF4405 domain-containing protein [Gammaproteobacteria bacterium]